MLLWSLESELSKVPAFLERFRVDRAALADTHVQVEPFNFGLIVCAQVRRLRLVVFLEVSVLQLGLHFGNAIKGKLFHALVLLRRLETKFEGENPQFLLGLGKPLSVEQKEEPCVLAVDQGNDFSLLFEEGKRVNLLKLVNTLLVLDLLHNLDNVNPFKVFVFL